MSSLFWIVFALHRYCTKATRLETRIGKKINLDPIVLSTKSLLGITAIAVAAHYGYCGPVWLAMGVLRQYVKTPVNTQGLK